MKSKPKIINSESHPHESTQAVQHSHTLYILSWLLWIQVLSQPEISSQLNHKQNVALQHWTPQTAELQPSGPQLTHCHNIIQPTILWTTHCFPKTNQNLNPCQCSIRSLSIIKACWISNHTTHQSRDSWSYKQATSPSEKVCTLMNCA